MPLTAKNKIWYADTSSPLDIAETSATQATSVENALNLRSRYDFSWNNLSERNAQQGMINGSIGFQIDTRSDYIYFNGSWQLKTPHAEFTASFTGTTGGPVGVGIFAYDPAPSTSSTFVVPGVNGQLVIVDPGVYAISSVSSTGGATAFTGRTFLDLTKIPNAGDQQRVSITPGEDRGSLSKANLRTTTANSGIYIQMYMTVAGSTTVNTRVFVTRIG